MLSYNLLSVSKVTEFGKTISFSDDSSQITGVNQKLVATAMRVGNLEQKRETKEDVWHRHFGHLGACNLQKLARKRLVLMVLTTMCQRKSISVNRALKGNIIDKSFQPAVRQQQKTT